MARDDPDDIEKLLAEVEGSLGGGSGSKGQTPAKRGSDKPAKSKSDRAGAVPIAVAVGVAAAAVNWVIFSFVPFVGATSAAWGAFLTAFVLTFFARWRR
jgi:hypothetical protein